MKNLYKLAWIGGAGLLLVCLVYLHHRRKIVVSWSGDSLGLVKEGQVHRMDDEGYFMEVPCISMEHEGSVFRCTFHVSDFEKSLFISVCLLGDSPKVPSAPYDFAREAVEADIHNETKEEYWGPITFGSTGVTVDGIPRPLRIMRYGRGKFDERYYLKFDL